MSFIIFFLENNLLILMALVISGNIVEYLRKKRELKNLIPTKILRLNSEIRKIMKIVFFIAIAMSVE